MHRMVRGCGNRIRTYNFMGTYHAVHPSLPFWHVSAKAKPCTEWCVAAGIGFGPIILWGRTMRYIPHFHSGMSPLKRSHAPNGAWLCLLNKIRTFFQQNPDVE